MDAQANKRTCATTTQTTARRATVTIFLRNLKVGTRFMLMRNGQKYTLLGLGMYKNRWTYTVQCDCEKHTSTLHHSCHVKPLERIMENTTQDPYANEKETQALLTPDTRTPYAQMLDQMLEIRGANEQGAEPYKILYRITVELLEAYYHGTEEQP